MTARAPIDGDELRVRIHRYLARHPGRTLDQIERAIPASRLAIAQTIADMAEDGEAALAVIRTGSGCIKQWWAT